MRKYLWFFFLFFLNLSSSYADTVYLKNGYKFEGTIVKESEDRIWIEKTVGLGEMKVVFYKDEIEKIEIDSQHKNTVMPTEEEIPYQQDKAEILQVESNLKTEITGQIKETPEWLELTIDIPKDSFVVGEEFEGRYVVENKRENLFRGFVVDTRRKQGLGMTCKGRGTALLGKISVDFGAFDITEAEADCFLKSFRSPGSYTYKVAVYDCAQIEKVFNITCDEAKEDRVMAEISPLIVKEKNVTVTGKAIAKECRTDSDCSTKCDKCEKGTYRCNMATGECIECFMDFHCKAGYRCEGDKCVKR